MNSEGTHTFSPEKFHPSLDWTPPSPTVPVCLPLPSRPPGAWPVTHASLEPSADRVQHLYGSLSSNSLSSDLFDDLTLICGPHAQCKAPACEGKADDRALPTERTYTVVVRSGQRRGAVVSLYRITRHRITLAPQHRPPPLLSQLMVIIDRLQQHRHIQPRSSPYVQHLPCKENRISIKLEAEARTPVYKWHVEND